MSNALVPTDRSLAQGAETNTAAAIAKARAEVEAQYLMAERRPRSYDLVRQRLLKECERTSFAEVALYELPRAGRKIVGPSIRFAEACRRISGNMIASTTTIYDGDEHQVIRVMAVDLETNAIEIDEITVTKFIERKSPKQGDEVIGQPRQNSYGDLVYKVRTTDDDFRIKRRAESQRAKRNAILALIPGDIIEEAVETINATKRSGVERDPDGERKRIVDGFAKLNVPADQLERYLGHDLATAAPAELLELQAVWVAVRDGEISWHEALAAKTGVEADKDESASRIRDKIAGVKDRLGKRAAANAGQQQPAPKGSSPGAAPKAEPAPEPPKKAKGGRKKKAAAPKADAAPAAEPETVEGELEEDPVADFAAAAGVGLDKARDMLSQGYEVDRNTGEVIPPEPGSDG